MTTKDIEEIATQAVKRSIITSGYLSQFISENDKEPSWDGFVYVYNDKSKAKSNFIGRVAVQIKGSIQTDLSLDKITFSVDVSDLKNFQRDGGAIYFVVYYNEDTQKEKIYYETFTPVKLISILESCKEKQKTKSITFRSFPRDNDKKATVFLQFYSDCKKQMSFDSKDLIHIDDFLNKDVIKSVTISVKGYGYSKNDIQQALLENEIYLYGQPAGTNLSVPFKELLYEIVAVDEVSIPISVNSKVFYLKFEKLKWKNGSGIKIGDSLFLRGVESNGPCVRYTPSPILKSRIRDLSFLLEAIENASFQLGNETIPFVLPKEELEKFDVVAAKRQLQYLLDVQKLLDMFSIHKDINISNLTQNEIKDLNCLVQAFVEGKYVRGLNTNIPKLNKIKIQNITFVFGFKEQEEKGMYEIYDFFNSNKVVVYESDEKGEMSIASKYSILQVEDYCEIDNISYELVVQSFQNILSQNRKIFDEANSVLLKSLLAYDKCGKNELLKLAKDLAQWIKNENQCEMPNEIVDLNLLQVIRRERKFSSEELSILLQMIESNSSTNDVKLGANILLGNHAIAELYLEKMTKKEKDNFLKFPICKFFKKG